MKTKITVLCALAALTAAFADPPELRIALDADEVVLDWESTPSNPGSNLEFFYGFQLEESDDLTAWSAVGEMVDTRIGGAGETYTRRLPLAGASEYYRLQFWVDLAGADFSGADLSGVDFGGAILTDADFSGADLTGTDFSGADLDGAVFDDALLEGAGLYSDHRGQLILNSLAGDPAAPLDQALPNIRYNPDLAAFTAGYPGVGATLTPPDTALVLLADDATVGSTNSLLAAHNASVTAALTRDDGFGFLVVKLATATHADLFTALEALRADPLVASAAPDALMERKLTTPTTDQADWTWGLSADGDNWGYEFCRIPQMWNLRHKIEKMIAEDGDDRRRVEVGVIDWGFTPHEDVPLYFDFKNGEPDQHGTNSASVITATHGNGLGLDGINPFSRVIGIGTGEPPTLGDKKVKEGETPTPEEERTVDTRAWGDVLVNSLARLMHVFPDLKVANISLGYVATTRKNFPSYKENFAMEYGKPHAEAVQRLLAGSPVIVAASAGNESNDHYDPTGFDLQMESVAQVGDLPITGVALAVIALVAGELYVRVFDANGIQIADASESDLIWNFGETPVMTLKGKLLPAPPDPATLTEDERNELILCAAAFAEFNLSSFLKLEAKFTSPFTVAGDTLNLANIFTVEAVGNGAETDFSNIQGHLSAPGKGVLVAGLQELESGETVHYHTVQGTSIASPFAAGIMSYLLAVDPDLSAEQMREVLVDNKATGIEVGGAAKCIDGWAAAMSIDQVRGDDAVLRMMIDVDDGTIDGNLRLRLNTIPDPGLHLVTPAIASVFEEENADADTGDMGEGDGSINMSDFRRWRDWLLQAEDNIAGLGVPFFHAKRDLNKDGEYESAAKENVYPRGDFNGDGKMDRKEMATSAVPGALGGDEHTDLGVLRQRFADRFYDETDLHGLLDSGDLQIIIDPNGELLWMQAPRTLRVTITPDAGEAVLRDISNLRGAQIEMLENEDLLFTIPEGNHTLLFEFFDGDGEKTGGFDGEIEVIAGGDYVWVPGLDDFVAAE